MSSLHYTTKYDERCQNTSFESLHSQVKFTKFLLMKKVIIITVNNTKGSCLYDFNSTGEFPGVYTALCYGIVDWEERGQGKPELAVTSLQLWTLLSKVISVHLWNKQCCMKECFILLFPLYSLVKILNSKY